MCMGINETWSQQLIGSIYYLFRCKALRLFPISSNPITFNVYVGFICYKFLV